MIFVNNNAFLLIFVAAEIVTLYDVFLSLPAVLFFAWPCIEALVALAFEDGVFTCCMKQLFCLCPIRDNCNGAVLHWSVGGVFIFRVH